MPLVDVMEVGALFGDKCHVPFGNAVVRFIGMLVEVCDGVAEREPGLLRLAEGAKEEGNEKDVLVHNEASQI